MKTSKYMEKMQKILFENGNKKNWIIKIIGCCDISEENGKF